MERLTRAKAIRAKCIDCMAGQAKEVKYCTVVKCPLFPYRMGNESKGGIYLPTEDGSSQKTPQNAVFFE